jgi:hypothetical protein
MRITGLFHNIEKAQKRLLFALNDVHCSDNLNKEEPRE